MAKDMKKVIRKTLPELTLPSSGTTSNDVQFYSNISSHGVDCIGWWLDSILRQVDISDIGLLETKMPHCGVMIVSCADQRCIELHSSKSPFS